MPSPNNNTHANEDNLSAILKEALDTPIPQTVQSNLKETLQSLSNVPQENEPSSGFSPSPSQGKRKRPLRAAIAIAASLSLLIGAGAFATSRLAPMQEGTADFFSQNAHLPIFNSLKAGATKMEATIGQSTLAGKTKVTLDSVTCDKSIILLFFTLEQDEGFNVKEQSIYGASSECDWSILQRISPEINYDLSSKGKDIEAGYTQTLDAYLEDGKIKIMQRIIPKSILPDEVDIQLNGVISQDDQEDTCEFSLNAGIDLSHVSQPRNICEQNLTFNTKEGEKILGIKRFTASELGCVLVADPNERPKKATDSTKDRPEFEVDDKILTPENVKVMDSEGNVLSFFSFEDGLGRPLGEPLIYDFASLSETASGITITPMLYADDCAKIDNASDTGKINVSNIGSKLPTSEFGGYVLKDRKVENKTEVITLEPYGWTGPIELVADSETSTITTTWTDEDTGEKTVGHHSGISWTKHDPQSGELLIMTSYYAASNEEIKEASSYHYTTSFNEYVEDSSAAQSLNF